jgi:hypothetical protein
MPYNNTSSLWPNREEHFFRQREIHPLRQSGPHCVSTVLAMLTGRQPEAFQGRVNTQDPVSWSSALFPDGLRLAYCPTDVRRLRFYLPELLIFDDLFTLSYYSPADGAAILQDPNEDGWVCGSHIVILHRSQILDPATGIRMDARSHPCEQHHTKRIFRLVPAGHARGL